MHRAITTVLAWYAGGGGTAYLGIEITASIGDVQLPAYMQTTVLVSILFAAIISGCSWVCRAGLAATTEQIRRIVTAEIDKAFDEIRTEIRADIAAGLTQAEQHGMLVQASAVDERPTRRPLNIAHIYR